MSDYGVDVLAFSPHPDDVEMACGGLLITLADRGHRVGVVDLTEGEMASRGSVEGRRAEAAAATERLGLSFRENLGLPDADLRASAERSSRQVQAIVSVLLRRRPELVLAPWREARHPDHAAASELIRRAIFLAGLSRVAAEHERARWAARQTLYYPLRVQLTPSFVVDVSAAAVRKHEAIRCYASQLSRTGGGAETLASSPMTLAMVEARDRYYGAMLGVAAGEPYRTEATLGLSDPVEHFRANDFEAQLFEERR